MALGVPSCRGFRAIAGSDRRHVIAKIDRAIDGVQALHGFAGAPAGDVAVIEYAAEDALIDIDALHFVHMQLDGVAIDESGLVADPPTGDGDVGPGGVP